MEWSIEYTKKALHDLKKIDPYNQKLILKAIEKTSEHPLPPPAGIGKPLSNNSSSILNRYYKIKIMNIRYRVVYGLIKQDNTMIIIVISIRNKSEVYKEAVNRIKNMKFQITQE